MDPFTPARINAIIESLHRTGFDPIEIASIMTILINYQDSTPDNPYPNGRFGTDQQELWAAGFLTYKEKRAILSPERNIPDIHDDMREVEVDSDDMYDDFRVYGEDDDGGVEYDGYSDGGYSDDGY